MNLSRQIDSRWSKCLSDWKPNLGHGRSQGHPSTRWTDSIEAFIGGDWVDIAADTSHWQFLEEDYVTFDGQFCGTEVAPEADTSVSALFFNRAMLYCPNIVSICDSRRLSFFPAQ